MGHVEVKWIVTGAGGFIGRRCLAHLREAGHEVVGVDRVPGPGVDVVSDLSDAAALRSMAGDEVGLIHLAWDLRRESATFESQSAQVSLLARCLEAVPWRQVIGIGSAEEYGLLGGTIRESDPPEYPLTPYGWAKRAAHDLVASWSDRTQTPALWLRPFLVYGEGQGGNMAIPYAVRQARAGAVAEFSDGLQQRDFIHVDDVAAAVVRAAERNRNGFRAINLGRGEAVPLRSVLEEIGRSLNALDRFRFGALLRRTGEPEVQVANVSWAALLLGWQAVIPWREGIARLCAGTGEPP